MYRPLDVLEFFEAAIDKLHIQTVAHIVMNPRRYTDPTRIGALLQTRGDIHAITMNVVAIDDDIAQIDADAQHQLLRRRDMGIAFGHALLDFQRTLGGFDNAGKFQQQPIAHGLDDTPATGRDRRVDQLSPMGAQCCKRAGLVNTHEP
jgi:hypothetical protein